MLAVVLSVSFSGAVHAWTPGVGYESDTSGFTVDRQSRIDVVSFWHAVYQESEGYEGRIDWAGAPGTTSAVFKGDVQRRLNYYRAMAGMRADMGMNSGSVVLVTSETPTLARPSGGTTKGVAAQAAAYMVSRNSAEYLPGGGVANGAHNPHNPPTSWLSDTATARNGSFYSNLASGFFGPDAMDAYMHENDQSSGGGVNSAVAHRRLILYSRRAEFSTGDVTQNGSNFSANALYCAGNLLDVTTPQFVAWPSEGYFPEPLSTKYWSLSFPDADFSSATVTMSHVGGGAISTSIVSRAETYGDKTLVWLPTEAQMPSSDAADQSINVTVENIVIGGVSQNYSYSVVLINPDRFQDSEAVMGSVNPPDYGAVYFFESVANAEEYEFDVSRQSSATWLEGAEDGVSGLIVDATQGGYELRTGISWSNSNFWDTENKAFRMAFYDFPLSDQSFIVNRSVIPQSGANVTFRMRRGIMTQAATLKVQSSTDGGGSWNTLASYSGNSNGGVDNNFATKQVSIPSIGDYTLVRFFLSTSTPNSGYSISTHPTYPVGIFIDGVEVNNCDGLESVATRYPDSATSVMLDASTAGGDLVEGETYILRLRTRMGNHWFPYGPALSVTPVAESTLTSYEAWMRSEYYMVGDFAQDYDGDGIPNGVERVFGLNPTDRSDASTALRPQIVDQQLQLSHSIISGGSVAAELSYTLKADSWEEVVVDIENGVATVSVPLGAPACYLRWKVNQ